MAQAIEAQREGAEVYHGAALCAEKAVELLAETNMPLGLLPLADMEEVGYNRATGFVWLRQKKALTHTFKQIGRQVSYATEVTAFVEDRKMKRMTGVKSKELLIWITLCDMFIDKDDPSKITFKTPTGLGRTFPVSAFEKKDDAKATAAAAGGKEAVVAK
ncbi:hypothetical protein D1007_18634 [Hordeum vulgare]|uniref:Predicted protein n=1 Tax=Hordeum vulgare subsp. vulgare TaxID=112509 RepID=F2CWJ6_HORVV|nr:uncharacterized protein LOC123443160 [Hordeum vulgare subsp. vulgare]KAE8805233.1 hypothetical protein D1007_18634 [Hordeum vulgare]KAI5005891.1 hypothetical protein ZWY2020_033134 [Hordeum vulgare]BAJ87217.1 predicted protein [Hordeum vulgare subsp. vulgare]BAK01617.1 predicted protein [Hordeum vulgare subsp. vulgare]BAK03502.1 predicted protein [Hordeum vulgare subsp. vulgare]